VVKSIFSPVKRANGCFGTKETRFGPYNDPKTINPHCYDIVRTRNSALRYSFGTSRDKMQKQFVDETVSLIKKGEASPAPDTY